MNRIVRCLPQTLLCALAFSPIAAFAQDFGYYGYSEPRFFFGGSIGMSAFSDNSNAISGWLNGAYTSTTPLSSGNAIFSSGSQTRAAFGARIYGGTWMTPNLGVEVGFASLGSVGWSVNSYDNAGGFSVNDSGSVDPYLLYEALLVGTDYGNVRYFAKAGVYQAFTDLSASSYDNISGGSFGASQTVYNNGGLVGLGMSVPYWAGGAFRVEVEDFLNVGSNSTTQVPPWRGNILLLSVGYTFLF